MVPVALVPLLQCLDLAAYLDVELGVAGRTPDPRHRPKYGSLAQGDAGIEIVPVPDL